MIHEAEVLEAVEAAMPRFHPVTRSRRGLQPRDTTEAILKNKESVAFLAHEIGKKLFALVLRSEEEIQTSVSLAGLGMDSLVAIEMRSWWKSTFGFNISMLGLLGMANVEASAADALGEMLKTLQE